MCDAHLNLGSLAQLAQYNNQGLQQLIAAQQPCQQFINPYPQQGYKVSPNPPPLMCRCSCGFEYDTKNGTKCCPKCQLNPHYVEKVKVESNKLTSEQEIFVDAMKANGITDPLQVALILTVGYAQYKNNLERVKKYFAPAKNSENSESDNK